MRIGINGLGRVGRAVLRNLWLRNRHAVVHVNDTNADPAGLAYLIKYDSIYGRFPGQALSSDSDHLTLVRDEVCWPVRLTHRPSIAEVPWAESAVDCVVEATGAEANAVQARALGPDGPAHVVVTNTFPGADLTLVFGLNETAFDPDRHRVLSSSICDAVAIAPVLRVIDETVGIVYCSITTLHPWLSYQNLLDNALLSQAHPASPFGYYPLGRASPGNLIPKPTSIGPVLESLLPALKGKVVAFSQRVPTSAVCSADVVLVAKRPLTAHDLKRWLVGRPELKCTDEMLVSGDYAGETASAVVDLRWLRVTAGRFVRLVLWYDNEWGYAARVVDILDRIARTTEVEAGEGIP